MTTTWSPEDDDRGFVAGQVREQIGAIFHNVRRGPGVCRVCTGPASELLCSPCDWHRRAFGRRTADLVVPLAYAQKGQQSGHHMYGYKSTIGSPTEIRRDLKLLVFSGMRLHRECIDVAVGLPWTVVTFVSSQGRPGTHHPVVELAQQVTPFNAGAARIVLGLGPDIAVERSRGPLATRFTIADRSRPDVRGRHVLVVDDTWVTGAKSQSAAITLKDAGAAAVTVLCVARWLDRAYNGHGGLIDALPEPYDALTCPVTGGDCPGA